MTRMTRSLVVLVVGGVVIVRGQDAPGGEIAKVVHLVLVNDLVIGVGVVTFPPPISWL